MFFKIEIEGIIFTNVGENITINIKNIIDETPRSEISENVVKRGIDLFGFDCDDYCYEIENLSGKGSKKATQETKSKPKPKGRQKATC